MSTKNMVESLREIVQDLLVPELKAVKVSIEALRTDMQSNTSAIRNEIKLSNEALREEMKLRHEASDPHTELLVRSLSEKLDFTMEIRERLASREARSPRQ